MRPHARPLPILLLAAAPVAAVLALAGCGGEAPAPEVPIPVPPAADPLAGGEHVLPAADGVPMRYAVRGAGHDGPTVVFVHGWMCRFTFWDFTAPHVAETYRTLALDLPGHGASGAGRERWTMAAYGDDVAHLIEALDLRDVVLVGHSMGGPVALRAAAAVPDRVLGVIGVDTFHNADLVLRPEQMAPIVAAYESDFAGTCARFVDAMFPEGADPVLEETTRAEMCSGRPEVGIALLRDFPTWELPAALRAVATVPVRAVNAATVPTAVEVNRKYAPDFDAAVLEGVGHFPHLERPEAFNALLDAAIAEVVAGAGRG